jgi:hypothetical protein
MFDSKPDFHQNTVKKKERLGFGGQELGCELPINSYNVSEMNFLTEKLYTVDAKEQDLRKISKDFNPKHCTENLSVSFATDLESSKHQSPADQKIFLGKSLPLEKIQFSGQIPTETKHPTDANDSNRKLFESDQDNKELLLIKKSLAIFEKNIDAQLTSKNQSPLPTNTDFWTLQKRPFETQKPTPDDSDIMLMKVDIDPDVRSYKNILQMHHKNSEKIVAIADDDDQTLSYYGNAMVTPEKQTKIQDKENNFRDSNRKPEVGEFN